MRTLDKHFIDGTFAEPHGAELFDLHNPATGQVIGQVRLGDRDDARAAIAAARRALPAMSRTTKAERIAMLHRMHAAVAARMEAINAAVVEEYGAPATQAAYLTGFGLASILHAATTLEAYNFTRWINDAEVAMQPLGVVGIITPWNSNMGFICGKLAMALAAGCT
ncbi:MAG: Aldehyde Dehydrogenase, partial [Phenylobacterium sp.]|nr:Aldehyde Dehydrogenase [Phenylobacterium sp.]